MNEHKLSASKQVFGRLAAQVAVLLRGKNKPDFKPHIMPRERVVITDIDKIEFSGKKFEQKKYFHYSGYPGGMKVRFLDKEFEKNPAKVFRHAVYGMLPKNRQRDQIIKNLIIK